MLSYPAGAYDRIRNFWNRRETSRSISLILLSFFLLVAFLILLNRSGCLPAPLSALVPTDTFASIRLAFSLVLAVEVLQLIFALSGSVSLAVSKQLEIMALLLLRESFIDISLLTWHVVPEKDLGILVQIGITAVSGLALFVIRIMFARWHYIHNYRDMQAYVNTKKCISFFCCSSFAGRSAMTRIPSSSWAAKPFFFEIFYTTLIFTDIFLVLAGQYFAPSFRATFRNSGFAVSTLLMRIAIGAPHHLGALLCVFAGLYLLALSWALIRFEGTTEPETIGK